MVGYYLLLTLLLLVIYGNGERIPRRVDSSEYEEAWNSNESSKMPMETVEATHMKMQAIVSKAFLLPDLSDFTGDLSSDPCHDKACAWTFYSVLRDGSKQIILAFNNRKCMCDVGSSCEYFADDTKLEVFIHRCKRYGGDE